MPFIGNTTGTEMMEHRISHTGDGTRTVFTVNYTDDSVSVYLNGVKMLHATDYTTNATGTNITFTQAPANGDVVDISDANFTIQEAEPYYQINNISSISEVTINKCYKKLETFKSTLIPNIIIKKYTTQ